MAVLAFRVVLVVVALVLVVHVIRLVAVVFVLVALMLIVLMCCARHGNLLSVGIPSLTLRPLCAAGDGMARIY